MGAGPGRDSAGLVRVSAPPRPRVRRLVTVRGLLVLALLSSRVLVVAGLAARRVRSLISRLTGALDAVAASMMTVLEGELLIKMDWPGPGAPMSQFVGVSHFPPFRLV